MPDEKYLSPENWIVPVTRNNYTQYREWLKRELLFKRHYRSDFSGKLITLETGCHLHEAVLTRANVPKSVSWFYKIFDERNCLLLLPCEHIPQPPCRKWAIDYLYTLYSKEIIQEWFYGLPFKSFPFQLP